MKNNQTIIKAGVAGMAVLLSILSLPFNSLAGDRKSSIMVSATVMGSVKQTVIRQTSSFSVTPESIKKGYVDLPAATVLQIQSNNPNGYLLSFEVDQVTAKEVWVMDNNRTTVVSGPVGFVPQQNPGTAGEVKEISYRIFLSPDMKPGLHPLPLTVYASLQ